MSQFNNGIATYRDFLLGAGAEYRICHGLSLSLKGGYSFGRELDYQRIDQTVKFGSSPFVQVGLKMAHLNRCQSHLWMEVVVGDGFEPSKA